MHRPGYFIIVLSLTLSACASHEIKQLARDPIAGYQIQATEGGVVVAADPFNTKEKAESAFTVDLTEQGFLPILLVVDNRATENVLLIKDDIELIDSRGNVSKPVSANVMISKFEHNKIAYALLGFGIFSYMSAEDANKKMLEDWIGKELPAEKVVLSNRTTHGVVYFYLGRGLQTLSNATLNVPLINMRTSERKTMTLRLLVP
jgi:hypothetical protein